MGTQTNLLKNYFLLREPFTSVETAFLWIESFYNAEKTGQYDSRIYRLDRMQTLLAHFENPHQGIPAIHIAGSKGKGSTAFLCASILNAYQLKVGLYQSPHLLDYRERITLNNFFFPDDSYLKGINTIYEKLPLFLNVHPEFKSNPPTVFELLTLLAFLIFKAEKCDCLVIETGLGGRLDATNCIDPILSIITRIELEHTEYLGKTLQSIAYEKGGIIKSKTPFLLTQEYPCVKKTLQSIAKKKEAPLFFAPSILKKLFGHRSIPIPKQWRLTIESEIQRHNAGNAVAAATLFLPALSLPFDLRKIQKGIEATTFEGRMEKIFHDPPFLIDGAHTPLSFAEAVKGFTPMHLSSGTLLFCAVEGKNILRLLQIAFQSFSTIIFTSAGSFRKNDPQSIYSQALALQKKKKRYQRIQLILEPDTQKAVKKALSFNRPTLAAGSFYLVGEIKKIIRDLY